MEKNTMGTFKRMINYRVVTLAVLALLFDGFATAQIPTYHPGQTLRISVTFEGPDAGRITQVQMVLATPKPDASQPGFSASINGGSSERKGNTNTFEVSWEIQPNQASGDYTLNQLNVYFDKGNQISLTYLSPADFPTRVFRIGNSGALIKPKIKDVQDTSKP
jgi:hypothetical protein